VFEPAGLLCPPVFLSRRLESYTGCFQPMKRTTVPLCLLLPLMGSSQAGFLRAEVPNALAIRDARIVTVSGSTLDKGTVVVRNGTIESVGVSVNIPADCWIVDGAGLTVYPGLFDALSTMGLNEPAASSPSSGAGRGGGRTPATPPTPAQAAAPPASMPVRGPEDRPSTTSWLRAADLVQPNDRRIETLRSGGFTTAAVFPPRGIVAGQGAVIDLGGERSSQMVVAPSIGMYETMSTNGFANFPGSLFGTMAYLRQLYIDAERYRTVKQDYARNSAGVKRPEYDRALEGVLETRKVLLPATRQVEMDRMIRLARDMKVDLVLYGGHEGYRAANMLKAAQVPVLVSLKWPERDREGDPEQVESLRILELRDRAPSTPAALAKAGVVWAFYTDSQDRAADVGRAVRRAIDAGLSREAALRALTLSPAEIWGVSDRLGSIDKGKIANLLVTRGDIFAAQTKVEFLIVDGVKYTPVPETPESGPGSGSRPSGPEVLQ
jgi:imidazolonepropionase-like amidohydrolase